MSSQPTITVLYFAAAWSETRLSTQTITLPVDTTNPDSTGFPLTDLGPLLVSLHPNTKLAKVLAESQWSVDAEMVEDASKVNLKGGEEVAVICPVSGG
jgi:hypothetical protein